MSSSSSSPVTNSEPKPADPDSSLELSQLEKLPVEVRVNILGMLPYSDLLMMRLLNHQFKLDIDEHMTFHLKFDQSYRRIVKKLATRRIKSCHFVYFSSRKLFHHKIFSHPNKLKRLTFDGIISGPNLIKILNESVSLEHLVLTHQTLGIDGLIQPLKFAPCLRKLQSLSHLNLQLLRYPQGNPFEAEENIEAFLQATFPNLISFRLYFSLFGNFKSLLEFLERHREKLREVELQVGDRGDSFSTERYLRTRPSLRIDESTRRNLLQLNLSKFRFRDDVLNLNTPAKDLIVGILLAQRNLQVLQFYSPGELTWSMLRNVTSNNENFLTEIVVYNIKTLSGPGPPLPEVGMDMSIFAKCLNLKTLALSCTSSNGNNPNVVEGVAMKMTNLHCISSSIESLHLLGFTLDGQELVYLSGKGKNLREVLIADAGTMRYSDVLNSFLKNCLGLKYLNVRPVVLQAANEQSWWKEADILSKLYERFMGISYDPIDDLEGFEANINESDKDWLKSYDPKLSAYSISRPFGENQSFNLESQSNLESSCN